MNLDEFKINNPGTEEYFRIKEDSQIEAISKY